MKLTHSTTNQDA